MEIDGFFDKLNLLESAAEVSFPDKFKAQCWALAKDMSDEGIEDVLANIFAKAMAIGDFKVFARKFLGKPPDWEPTDDDN